MNKYDIVYVLKDDPEYNEELVYSLRSVDKNFPHNRVIFAGGCPAGVKPDLHIPLEQSDTDAKWGNVSRMMREICKNDEITKRFFLFNDDFFVLKPITSWLANYFDNTLFERLEALWKANLASEYAKRLRTLDKSLRQAFYPTLNFAIHVPMLIDRAKMLEVSKKFPETSMYRALYGNYVFYEEGGLPMKDNKIIKLDRRTDDGRLFVSTNEMSFAKGEIGKQIREMFKKKSRFEKGGDIG